MYKDFIEDTMTEKQTRALSSADANELLELSYDSDWEVRANVASNPHTSRDVLHRLRNDSNRWVREAVSLEEKFGEIHNSKFGGER